MDRQILYPGAIAQDTDLTNTVREVMIAMGYLMEATFGSTTVVNGLQCLPASPTPNLTVTVGRGMIASMEVVDQYPYGSLAADTSDPLMKMGINLTTTTFTITPPATAGYSQNYLIECQFYELDTTPVVLPYYNSANPSVPYTGPANSGTAQNTQVIQRAQLQLKAGVPAAAGTQTTPGADSGWTPLWVVSVNNGQTQITSTSISAAPGAPRLLTQLSQLPYKLMGNLTLYVSQYGSDSNNGVSAATPFLTIQAAWNALSSNYNLNGYAGTISIGAGTFAPVLCSGQPTGSAGPVSIVGAGASTIISTTTAGAAAIFVESDAAVNVSNLTVQSTGSGGTGLYAGASGTITDTGGVYYGACTSAHRQASAGSLIIQGNSYITGSAAGHLNAQNGGAIFFQSGETTALSGTLNFSNAFANCTTGQINIGNGHTWNVTGTVTGARFNVSYGGAIITNTSGYSNYLPGSIAGTNNSGGANAGYYY